MKADRVDATDAALLDLDSALWSGTQIEHFEMLPTPLAMVGELSPFLAVSRGHGSVTELRAAALHNGRMMAVRLDWPAGRHDAPADLNSFVDGVAVMYPLALNAVAITMGAQGAAVNAWYWKANRAEPYEIVAEGFQSVQRLEANTRSDLTAVARHRDGEWHVVFRRSLVPRKGLVSLVPGRASRIAFAVWDGGNAERSGRKSFSGEFIELLVSR